MRTPLFTAAALVWPVMVFAQLAPVGYTDTPYLPDGRWRVHDLNRPHPKQIKPGVNGSPPSDAIVLFDGTSLSKWTGMKRGKSVEPGWKVENGYVECVPETSVLVTKDKFGDIQLHIEWASPAKIEGESQDREDSGVILMGRYEVQVLDSYQNVTYADGQAASMYGQYPSLVNGSRKHGERQTYDLVFEAPVSKMANCSSPRTLPCSTTASWCTIIRSGSGLPNTVASRITLPTHRKSRYLCRITGPVCAIGTFGCARLASTTSPRSRTSVLIPRLLT